MTTINKNLRHKRKKHQLLLQTENLKNKKNKLYKLYPEEGVITFWRESLCCKNADPAQVIRVCAVLLSEKKLWFMWSLTVWSNLISSSAAASPCIFLQFWTTATNHRMRIHRGRLVFKGRVFSVIYIVLVREKCNWVCVKAEPPLTQLQLLLLWKR